MRVVDAIVVGAGPAGLATSAALTARGVEHEVLESARVGESWRGRWESFRLNTPGLINPMLGPLGDDEYSTRDEVVQRLDLLAEPCPVRTGTPVTELEPSDGHLLLTTSAGPVRTRAVVAATGGENVPRVPPGAASLPQHVAQRAVGTYRSPDELPDGGVLVVGSGQSGVQVVDDLLRAGRRVLLATSAVGRLPSPYRGRSMVAWLIAAGFFDQRPEDVPLALQRMPNPLLAPGGHGPDLRALARDGVTLLGRATAVDGTRVRLDGSARANVAVGETFAQMVRGLADDVITRLGVDAPPAEPDTDVPWDVDERDEIDLRAEGVTSVVWCAGMRGSHTWLPASALDPDGRPLQSHGRSPVPGVWLMGLRWMTRRGSGNFVGMPRDAATVADEVVRHLGR